MSEQYTAAQLRACRCLAMENKKIFSEANALSRCAFDLLDQPDFDSEKFYYYLQLRRKAEVQYREAIDHLTLLDKLFPPLAKPSAKFNDRNLQAEKKTTKEHRVMEL